MSFFGLSKGAQVGRLHNGTSVDVGRIFIYYASGFGIPQTLNLEEGEAFHDNYDAHIPSEPAFSWASEYGRGILNMSFLRPLLTRKQVHP